MRPIWHIITSFILAVAIFLLTRDMVASSIAFLAGIFIDLDHLLDFWISAPKNAFSIKQFYNMDKHLKSKGDHYTFIFFHAWEWIIVLVFLTFIYSNVYFVSFVLAVSLHLVLDTINNNIIEKETPLVYSIIFRIFHKFRMN